MWEMVSIAGYELFEVVIAIMKKNKSVGIPVLSACRNENADGTGIF